MENVHWEGASARTFQFELGQVIDLPVKAGNQDDSQNRATEAALALHLAPAQMQRLLASARIRTLLNAVDADGLPVPLVVLAFGGDAVLALLEPGDARMAEVLAAASERGWLPVMLHDEHRACVVAVDLLPDAGALLGIVKSAPPPDAMRFVRALAIALDAVPALFETLPASERPTRVAHHLVASNARLLMQMKAAQAVLAKAAALGSTATMH